MIGLDVHREAVYNHWYVIGGSQAGKTTLLKNLMVKDMEEGHGLCVIDMHGDLAREIICSVPRHRIDDVIYFNPTSQYAPSFNFLALPIPAAPLALAIGSLFKEFSQGWGQRLEQIIIYALLTLIIDLQETKRPRTFADLPTLLTNTDFRDEVLAGVQVPRIHDFWKNEFPRMEKSALNSVTNKLTLLLLPTSVQEHIFSKPDNDLDFFDIMNNRKILIVRIAKSPTHGGQETAVLLGSIIIRFIQLAALARESIPINERAPFFLYVDEFQNLADSPFESIIEEVMKFKVYLRLAHHRLTHLSYDLFSSIATSIQVFVAYHISAESANQLQKEMHLTRTLFRIKETNKKIPVDGFTDFVREYLTQKHDEYTARLNDPNINAGPSPNWNSFWAYTIKNEIDHSLRVLKQGKILPDTLKEIVEKRFGEKERKSVGTDQSTRLFPDVELTREQYPTVEDLTKLKPIKEAFIRIKYSGEIQKFKPAPPPPMDIEVRKAILLKTKERYEARMRSRGTQEPQKSGPPPSPLPKQRRKKPRTEDDFLNKP